MNCASVVLMVSYFEASKASQPHKTKRNVDEDEEDLKSQALKRRKRDGEEDIMNDNAQVIHSDDGDISSPEPINPPKVNKKSVIVNAVCDQTLHKCNAAPYTPRC